MRKERNASAIGFDGPLISARIFPSDIGIMPNTANPSCSSISSGDLKVSSRSSNNAMANAAATKPETQPPHQVRPQIGFIGTARNLRAVYNSNIVRADCTRNTHILVLLEQPVI